MHSVAILGAGKIGAAIAKLLSWSGDYNVVVADKNERALARLNERVPGIETCSVDIVDEDELVKFLEGRGRVISACPYFVNPLIARAALRAGISYFDLTEDRETTRTIMEVASKAGEGQTFMPQCGLAPGFISILAYDLCQGFDELDNVKMRVGALPQFPSNMMMYNLTWSTDGLINEYCNPCEAIHENRLTEVLALEGLELFSLDGKNYEAFNTSGGLGTLCETLDGKVRNLNYKTVRYKGHQYLMQFLVNELHLGKRRDVMQEILENAIPITLQDVTLIFCTVSGWIDGKLTQRSNARKIYNREIQGEQWSSIQVTTAAGMCAVVDLATTGQLGSSGFIKQESVPFDAFISNRFGQYYATGEESTDPEVRIETLTDFAS
jgi:saccharopine dehydrogenase-like NADP-dependent oxidoreductase